ncbi:hypothetical protein GGD61_008371 [Bradyrhizobium sp. SBR1B]|nr:hypothetical protein [Bradyrhizobium sp. SBR1B]
MIELTALSAYSKQSGGRAGTTQRGSGLVFFAPAGRVDHSSGTSRSKHLINLIAHTFNIGQNGYRSEYFHSGGPH